MTRLYLSLMVFTLVCDLFDRWFERTAVRVDGNDMWPTPDRFICWGIITNAFLAGCRRDLRFLRVRVPGLRTWGYLSPMLHYPPERGFRQHWLIWIEGARLAPDNEYLGWRLEPPLPP